MDFIRRNRVGIALIIGAIMTLIWIFSCPKFILAGTARTNTPVVEYHNSIAAENFEVARHIDLTYFIPGLVVIWTGEVGVLFLLTDITLVAYFSASKPQIQEEREH